MRTEITQAVFDSCTPEQQQVINSEFSDRRAKGLPVPTLEEVKAIHPRKFDPGYEPPPLSAHAIRAVVPAPIKG